MKWTSPLVIVIGKGKVEESVLTFCKGLTGQEGPNQGVNDGCSPGSSAVWCSTPSTS